MEKNILRQLDSIRKEIIETNRRIQSATDKMRRLEEGDIVSDTVTGGAGGTQHFKIQGFPSREYSKQKNMLLARRIRLSTLKEELLGIQEKAELYITTMTDSECRRIASFRYIDNLKWKKVAENMGEGYTEDACRMLLDRYLKKNN